MIFDFQQKVYKILSFKQKVAKVFICNISNYDEKKLRLWRVEALSFV